MITVTNPDDDDAIYSLDCDTDITLADLKALLEADVSSASKRAVQCTIIGCWLMLSPTWLP